MVWDTQMKSWEVVNTIMYFQSALKHYFCRYLHFWKGSFCCHWLYLVWKAQYHGTDNCILKDFFINEMQISHSEELNSTKCKCWLLQKKYYIRNCIVCLMFVGSLFSIQKNYWDSNESSLEGGGICFSLCYFCYLFCLSFLFVYFSL